MKKYSLQNDSSISLTEFGPLSSEITQPSSQFSFFKIFKWNKAKNHSDNTKGSTLLSDNGKDIGPCIKDEVTDEFSDTSSGESSSVEKSKTGCSTNSESGSSMQMKESELYTRSFTNVLKRISSILDKRLSTPNSYKECDFKQYWMPDSDCKECYDCGDKFTTFRRRHHCRVCGQIFCNRCCNQEIPGKFMGYPGELRVCTYCCKVVLACLQSTDGTGDSSDLRSLQEDLQNRLSFLNKQSDSPSVDVNDRFSTRRRNSIGFREQGYFRSWTTSSNDDSIYSGSREFKIPEQSSNEWKLLTQDSTQLRDLWLQIQHPITGIQFHNHRHRLLTYPNCVVGSELVEWLIVADKACSRHQAVAICQALLDSRYLEPVISQEKVFVDGYALYRAGMVGLKETQQARAGNSQKESQEVQEPNWVMEINQDVCDVRSDTDEFEDLESTAQGTLRRLSSSRSMFYVTLDPAENSVSLCKNEESSSSFDSAVPSSREDTNEDNVARGFLTKSEPVQNSRDCINEDFLKGAIEVNASSQDHLNGWHSSQNLRKDNDEQLAFERISLAYNQHEKALLHQLIHSFGLSHSWATIILPIAHKVAKMVKTNFAFSGEMDVRQFIQFKKVPGGQKSDCKIINGVVCTKNVSHKKMKCHILNPSILLISSPIIYQRQENKLLSLDPAVLQEFNCLKNSVAKISTFKPDVVLVEKTVSRLAQDFLLDLDITLVLNVKPSVIERVSRLTEADIVSSIDAQLTNPPKLGKCLSFQVSSYVLPDGSSKTLMIFDGCKPHLGCTVMVRGADNAELSKVKRIAQFMIYTKYNQQLERSFFMDECAMPPPVPDDEVFGIGEESGHSPSPRSAIRSQSSVGNRSALETSSAVKKVPQSDRTAEHDGEKPVKDKRCETKCVDDHSDPLRSYQKFEDDSIFEPQGSQLKVANLPLDNQFRLALDGTVLSVSPSVKYSLPYLETEAGRNCPLRKFLPKQIYWSPQFGPDRSSSTSKKGFLQTDVPKKVPSLSSNLQEFETDHQIHPFLTVKIMGPSKNYIEVQTLLADFRAQGEMFGKGFLRKSNEGMGTLSRLDDQDIMPSNEDRLVDALDPANHQHLPMLFCSYSFESLSAPICCVHPWIPQMVFYGWNDISLGSFLEKYCFRTSYICPNVNCDRPMTEHVRRFVHETGAIHILLHQMEETSKRYPDILMWSWCRKCKKSTPVVSMSTDTKSLSFSKYLELRFYNSAFTRRGGNDCTHSLHHDHYQYFACERIVTAFKYSPIVLREVVLPPSVVEAIPVLPPPSMIIEEIKHFAPKGHGIFSNVLDRISRFKEEWDYTGTKFEDMVQDMTSQLQAEHNIFKDKIVDIQVELTSPVFSLNSGKDFSRPPKDVQDQLLKIGDQVVELKRLIAEMVVNWNNRLIELAQLRKKEEKSSKSLGSTKAMSSQASMEHTGSSELLSTRSVESVIVVDDNNEMLVDINFERSDSDSERSDQNRLQIDPWKCVSDENGREPPSDDPSSNDESSVMSRARHSLINRSLQSSIHKISSEPVCLCSSSVYDNAEEDLTTASPTVPISQNFTLNEEDGGENGSHTADVEAQLGDAMMTTDAVVNESRGHERSRSDGDGKAFLGLKMKLPSTVKPAVEDEHVDIGKVEKKATPTMKHVIYQLLQSSSSYTLPLPFPPTEHHLLPHCERIPLIVYENEPSSIIAYALNSADYELGMQELKLATVSLQKDSRNSSPLLKRKSATVQAASSSNQEVPIGTCDNIAGNPRKIGGVLSFFRNSERDSPSWPHRTNSPTHGFEAVHYTANVSEREITTLDEDLDDCDSLVSSVENDKDNRSKPNGKQFSPHIEVQFADTTAKFYCRVFFAEQFVRLRKLLIPGGEEGFIRSLSRCNDWRAKGGKSGCTFCKTRDNRYILKQMTRLEAQSFLDFAPHYIQYLTRAYNEQKPTVFAKIVGAFRIVYRNMQSNVTSKMDLLVMENVFYGRDNISQTFDLKGSIRNRLVATSGKLSDDIVLLDENLLNMTCDHPLYIRPHSKMVLTQAITNDTKFLSQHLIMDYSLLVGIDDEEKDLVVGIIDYIRTFTWDKKLETLVKSSMIMGGQGKLPTVVSPEIYRSRFCEAMDRYFLQVPDHWSSLGVGVDF